MRKLAFLMLVVGLAGCSNYSSNFDCPYGDGVGCASLSKVNRLLDQGRIDTSDDLSIPPLKNKRQIPVYFGPEKMDKIITIKDQAYL